MKKTGVSDWLMCAVIAAYALFCLVPMLLVVAVSLSDEATLMREGFQLIPKKFSIAAYALLFKNSSTVLNSYLVTIFVTASGTALAVAVTMGAAFCLANKQVYYRNVLAFFFFFTMLFSGGLVPWYLINSYLGLRNNLFALIVPSLLFNAFNMFLVRNFMAGIPDSLMESARIDGAGDTGIMLRIYLPLCVPVLAAVSLFYAIGYWNDWWNAIMLVEDSKLYPLQYFLFKLQSDLQMLRDIQQMTGTGGAFVLLPTESLKMATCVLTIGPILLLYPFLQRYFIHGLVIGSVKG